MEKLPHKKDQQHGGVRGDDLDRRSSQFEGLFGRIFRSVPAASWPEKALQELAGDGQIENRMSSEPERNKTNPRLPSAPREDVDDNGNPHASRLHDDEENSGIDAGYTYLGQFIDHDITFDPASSLQKQNDVNALVDFRTPRLDLDCMYGRGPNDQPYLYQSDGKHFLIGKGLTPELHEGVNGKVLSYDLPRHTWHEHTKDSAGNAITKSFHRALIGDKRNDENVIVSQLHGVFMQFHNRYVDEHEELTFAQIQRQVRWHYQYVVLHDYLYKIAPKDVIESVLPHLKADSSHSIFEDTPKLRFYKPRNDAFMPIEFSAAAYRFGHSMVRPIYRLNTKLSGGNNPDETNPNEIDRGIDGRQFIFAGLPHRGLNGFDRFPQEWGIDWNLFFDLDGNKDARIDKTRTQPAYKIDTSLVNPLAFLPEFSNVKSHPPLDSIDKLQAKARPGEIPNLAYRNLLRGMNMSLPSGQDVAMAMGLIPLTDEELKVGKATNQEEYDALQSITSLGRVDNKSPFDGKAPLWYYILAEAQHNWRQNGGLPETPVQLGEVGGRIVVETLVGMLLDDGHSILRQAPAWTPSLGKQAHFDMADFIKYALNL